MKVQYTKTASEVWKPVVGLEGFYEVSESGLVYSVPRIDVGGVPRGGHLLKPRVEKAGYLSVQLLKPGYAKRRKVHHLVIEAFVGLRPHPDLVCRHLDDNKLNNYWKNLEWGTQKENGEDKVRNGRCATGERNGGGGKLTESDVKEIKRMLDEGMVGASIARAFGISRGMVYHIAKGRVWK